MGWTFEVDTDLLAKNFTTKLKLSLFGALDADVTLDIQPNAKKKSVVKGGIDFKCQESKASLAISDAPCNHVMYDLKRDPPAETSKISATLLKDQLPSSVVVPAGGFFKAAIIQPTVKITPDMQVTATNEGKCYNVFVDVKAEFAPGKIELTDFLKGVAVSAVAELGSAANTRLQAEYRVCCCEWDNNLPEYNPATDGDLKPDADLAVPRGDCKGGEDIKLLSCKVTGDTKAFSMTIKAIEQDCPYADRTASKLVRKKADAPKEVTHP